MFCWCLQETITTSKEVKFTVDNIDGSADVIQTNSTQIESQDNKLQADVLKSKIERVFVEI